jgi:hypothetical protein
MSDTWSTWHCEKCQIVLPWKDGMEKLKCVGCEMKAENIKLRELLRWRSTESELPAENEFCLAIIKNSAWPNVIRHSGTFSWSQSVITHWRPIGPLPEIPVASDSNSSSSTRKIAPLPGGK